jgi:uncharacterized SAM-binding protein YcdF (DUF218 family)
MSRNRRITASGIVLLCLIAGFAVFHEPILFALGNILVKDGPPRKAGIIVVIGGDYNGNRILKASQLLREGYAPRVLVSGIGNMYGFYEADIAIAFAVQHGAPRDAFISLKYAALSTRDEAAADVKAVREAGLHSYILVTSEPHTRRASRLFREAGPELQITTVGAPDDSWDGGYWWRNREGRKLWFNESLKTVTGYFGI